MLFLLLFPAVPTVAQFDARQWPVIIDGDFRERIVDEVDSRIRLRVDTIGTSDRSVKFLGVRSPEKIGLEQKSRIEIEVDWNGQVNGSYLSAAVVLSPHSTDVNPLATPDWLKIEYIGVPPGQNARLWIDSQQTGRRATLYTEGWPETNRRGRKVGVQKIGITFNEGAFQISENGKLVFDSSSQQRLGFESAYLYFQISSHSNYSARELYFRLMD